MPLVEQWLNGGAPNYGFMLIASGDKDSKYLSREEKKVDKQPFLEITFVSTSAVKTVDVQQDTYINQKDANKNFGDKDKLELKLKSGETRQVLVQFDLASVPTGSVVTSATVGFWVENDSQDAVSVHQITHQWSEYSATWNDMGSNYATTAVASFIPSSKDQIVTVDVTALVQQWVNGSVPNYGLMLLGHSDKDAKLQSKETKDGDLRPFLQIVYSSGGNVATANADSATMIYIPLITK